MSDDWVEELYRQRQERKDRKREEKLRARTVKIKKLAKELKSSVEVCTKVIDIIEDELDTRAI